MIVIVAGKSIKGAVTITVPSSDSETAHSVAQSPAP